MDEWITYSRIHKVAYDFIQTDQKINDEETKVKKVKKNAGEKEHS
jgi:hypothetical protein